MSDFYQKHIFFCTNQKAEGKKCCANAGAEELFAYTKKRLAALGQHGEGKIRVSKSGCLGRCENGPCLVIYPEQTWYKCSDTDDADAIINQDLLHNHKVESLEIL